MALPDKLDDVMVKKILCEINMNERELEEALVTMKQWLQKRPHLPESASEDALLKAFIVGCKSVERAKTKLDYYFTYRLTYKDSFFSRDTMEINWNKVTVRALVLPGMTVEGCSIILCTLPNIKEEVADFELEETWKVTFMIMDSYFREYCVRRGLLFACDMSNLTSELVLKYSLTMMASGIKIYLNGYPDRIKGIYAFNAPVLAETFFGTFVSPFFSTKVNKRLHFHAEDHRCLEKYFPLEMLPMDYEGGKAPSTQTLWSNIRMRLESEQQWFLNEGSQTVNEDLRPLDESDKLKGTFRKLQID